ncbi:hypothetical protein HELRODRAFT_182315 [Helobdella robusta]|uniref:Uncharacterized protein n=1 Tax=Helobdella robusta TaxID=6412 RepID=T1FI18_HELRO|nr:hypothetical protein HELRODRAFT_182315 [Helobdella robusta]ESN91064.1 hypothetical protein HELRODRAFT_182315 [Helobdella robusta]
MAAAKVVINELLFFIFNNGANLDNNRLINVIADKFNTDDFNSAKKLLLSDLELLNSSNIPKFVIHGNVKKLDKLKNLLERTDIFEVLSTSTKILMEVNKSMAMLQANNTQTISAKPHVAQKSTQTLSNNNYSKQPNAQTTVQYQANNNRANFSKPTVAHLKELQQLVKDKQPGQRYQRANKSFDANNKPLDDSTKSIVKSEDNTVQMDNNTTDNHE